MASKTVFSLTNQIGIMGEEFRAIRTRMDRVSAENREVECAEYSTFIIAKSNEIVGAITDFLYSPSPETGSDVINKVEEMIFASLSIARDTGIDQEGEAFRELIQLAKRTIQLVETGVILTSSDNLEAPTLPDQRPAPLNVAVQDETLRLVHSQTQSGRIDYPSANRLREGLRDTFRGLVDELPTSTNVDKRYVKTCTALLAYLDQSLEDVSIEAFGLSYQLVQKLTKRMSDEIDEMLLVEVEHVLTGIGVLLNQFEDWKIYLKEVATSQLNVEDASGLVENARLVVAALKKPGAPVDPRIAARLEEMIEPAVSGIVSAETIAIPLACSLSNFFTVVSQYAVDRVAAYPVEFALGSGSLLLGLAIELIQRFCPILSKYEPLRFLVDVTKYLNKLYSPMKDVFSSLLK
ncbi:hypothetical protein [Methylobacterium sp. B1]|uniref:hypothetical protein n=1 Tax=Methylobacterium sp. B1 TaxID=91459 RepID=UPI0011D1C4D4|nr:hypothetical protein [Methylobacterium sp. B1]